MADSVKVYTAVDGFLCQQGYHAHLKRKTVDEHWLQHTIAELNACACACFGKGCCMQTYFTNPFAAIGNIPGWSSAHEAETLKAGGFLTREAEETLRPGSLPALLLVLVFRPTVIQ